MAGEPLERVEALVNEIRRSGSLFRGEPEHYPKVSSTLHRRFKSILGSETRITPEKLQGELARFARDHFAKELRAFKQRTGEIVSWSGGYDPGKFNEDDVRVWSMMQHMGAATNLIDFTKDPRVALFFACSESLAKSGRVLVLRRGHGYDCVAAKWPQNRIEAQRSQFVWSTTGYVSDDNVTVIDVPQNLKLPALKWLIRESPPVSHATMFEDMPGYAKHSQMYEETLVQYYDSSSRLDGEVDRLRNTEVAGHLRVQDLWKTLKQFEDDARKMRVLVKKFPWFHRAHWLLGKMLEAQWKCWSNIADHTEADPALSGQLWATRTILLGDAIRAYQEALDWVPSNDLSGERVTILVDLGVVQKLNGNDQEAEAAFELARKADSKIARKLIADRCEELGIVV
ncbi:FRG domain-containing protein [Candidatus Foliamicus sp.]